MSKKRSNEVRFILITRMKDSMSYLRAHLNLKVKEDILKVI